MTVCAILRLPTSATAGHFATPFPGATREGFPDERANPRQQGRFRLNRAVVTAIGTQVAKQLRHTSDANQHTVGSTDVREVPQCPSLDRCCFPTRLPRSRC